MLSLILILIVWAYCPSLPSHWLWFSSWGYRWPVEWVLHHHIINLLKPNISCANYYTTDFQHIPVLSFILARIPVISFILALKVLNFWKFTSYCSLKPLWSGMGDVVPARTSPTLHPPSPPTVHQLSRLALLRVNPYCMSILSFPPIPLVVI